jgi:hypothetical protein
MRAACLRLRWHRWSDGAVRVEGSSGVSGTDESSVAC